MPDIRSFFGPKGGAAAPKPAPKKVDEPVKGRRTRKVVEDSDDEEEPAAEYILSVQISLIAS